MSKLILSQAKQGFTVVALAVATLLTIGVGRLYFDSKRHFEAGKSLLKTRQLNGARAAFEDAAKAYFPGNPYTKQALNGLELMAKAAQMRGDKALAKGCFLSMRRSILATRHFVIPHQDRLSIADKGLQRLFKEKAEPSVVTKMLHLPKDPSPVLSLFLFVGLFFWILGTVLLCIGIQKIKMRIFSMGSCVLGLGLWIGMCFWA